MEFSPESNAEALGRIIRSVWWVACLMLAATLVSPGLAQSASTEYTVVPPPTPLTKTVSALAFTIKYPSNWMGTQQGNIWAVFPPEGVVEKQGKSYYRYGFWIIPVGNEAQGNPQAVAEKLFALLQQSNPGMAKVSESQQTILSGPAVSIGFENDTPTGAPDEPEQGTLLTVFAVEKYTIAFVMFAPKREMEAKLIYPAIFDDMIATFKLADGARQDLGNTQESPGAPQSNHASKPWPKICLTKGCVWQEVALASASTAGAIKMAQDNQAAQIETADEQRAAVLSILKQYQSSPDANGYVPYSSFRGQITVQVNGQQKVLDLDKALFGADRSVPIRLEDLSLAAEIFNRIRNGPYRVTSFYWTVIPTRVVNSSAFPDPAFINVYSAIFDLTQRNPDELAFVFAHEVGHTIDAKACSGSGAAFNASFGIPLIQNQFQKFCENHADNIGLQLMVGAGYDPRGAIRVFQKLQAYQQQQGMDNASAFLGNHPLNASRIKNINEILPIILNQAKTPVGSD